MVLSAAQVILVGDFNIAAGPADVHEAIPWEGMYHPSELNALQGLTGPEGCACVDTWRHLHPHSRDVYTVWEERKSARSFNVVSGAWTCHGKTGGMHHMQCIGSCRVWSLKRVLIDQEAPCCVCIGC